MEKKIGAKRRFFFFFQFQGQKKHFLESRIGDMIPTFAREFYHSFIRRVSKINCSAFSRRGYIFEPFHESTIVGNFFFDVTKGGPFFIYKIWIKKGTPFRHIYFLKGKLYYEKRDPVSSHLYFEVKTLL